MVEKDFFECENNFNWKSETFVQTYFWTNFELEKWFFVKQNLWIWETIENPTNDKI